MSTMYLQAGILLLSLGALAQDTPRVIGGRDAPNHKYPYQISFRSRGFYLCSGSIVHPRWILSAAHCFKGRDLYNYVVVAGTNYLNETGTVYWPLMHFIHEKYTNFTQHDIALVLLKRNIDFTDFIKPIPLPNKDLQDYGKPAAFAGWGSTKINYTQPNALQEISLRLLTNNRCKLYQRNITDTHICTLNKYGEGVCHGDSGSPLVVDGVQVGIASYVTPCAINYPDVFTRVWSYMDWIDDTIEKYGNIWE